MGNVESKKKVSKVTGKWINKMCMGALLLALYCTFFPFYSNQNQGSEKNLRIQYAHVVADAQAGEYEKLDSYPCAIVGVNGSVIYSNISSFVMGTQVNLHRLSNNNIPWNDIRSNQFICPLVKDNMQFATIVIELPPENTQWIQENIRKWTIMLVLLLGIFYYAMRLRKYIKKEIEEPVKILERIADNILRGNYKKRQTPSSESEIGFLFRKMELLGDELQNSSIQAKKLHENEKMLLACISHDLKTPIATIIGCAEGIRDGVAKNPADVGRYVEIILTKSKLLTKLINDILEHTNAELEELSVYKEEIYAKKFMEEVLRDLGADIQGRGIRLKVEEIPDVLLDIAPDRIFQVFQNVIGNSMKYTKEGGIIHIGFELCQDALAVAISDNGQGIVATDIPFIFQRFYRGEKARTQKEIMGSGLGLSIVKNIIERHGGRVECDSVLGQGTTIRFLLPMV